jgi:hypothetical protein
MFNSVYPFLDDWTVIAGDFSEGLALLKEVFDHVRQANVKFKGTKCKLFQVRAKILGLLVEDRQVSEDPVRIQKIQNWAFPRTAKELRAFLGFVGFSRQFYEGYAGVAQPLTDCLKKGAKLEENDDTRKAFEQVKQLMINSPTLSLFNPEAEQIIETDASGKYISGVYKNRYPDETERVISFASCCLNAAETRYCTTKRELLATVFALKYWRHFLLGRRVIIRCDNAALSFLLRGKNLTNQLDRYLNFLAIMIIRIEYYRGKSNLLADFLSRRPCGGCKQCFSDASRCARISEVRDGGDVRSCTLSAAQPPISIADVSCDDISDCRQINLRRPPTAQVTELNGARRNVAPASRRWGRRKRRGNGRRRQTAAVVSDFSLQPSVGGTNETSADSKARGDAELVSVIDLVVPAAQCSGQSTEPTVDRNRGKAWLIRRPLNEGRRRWTVHVPMLWDRPSRLRATSDSR